jgi:anaerobic selenocysteine-containing dehydrogenase
MCPGVSWRRALRCAGLPRCPWFCECRSIRWRDPRARVAGSARKASAGLLCNSSHMSFSTVRAACPHDCPDTCAIRVSVQDGRAIRVQGDPDHPPTHGALCTKVSRYPERTYHPERVLRPMKRVGRKGSGHFEPVGWDEALGDIAARLKRIAARDPQAIVPYSYAGTMGLLQGESMAARFFHRLGASLLDRTICSSAGGDALVATYGGKIGMHLEFFGESKLILIWGSNSIASNLHFWTFAQAAKRQGAKLICIDPRRTETADKCHQHIALLPGTDGALALGVMHELIVNDWLDEDYIARHTDGWPALRRRALQWPPGRAAAVCGITAEEVRGLARDYGTTRPAAIRLNYGMQRVRGGGNAARLIMILPCLTGAWRHRAGGLLLSSSGWFKPCRDDAALQRPDLLGARRPRTINMSTIGDDLLRESSPEFGPRIAALVVYNSNPVAVAPESPKVVKGFEREDLFTVVLEHFMTDTADHADYVLPATTQLEHLDVHTSYGHTWVMFNEPAIAPLGEAKPNTQIFRELAARMGFDEPCFRDDDETLARAAFGPQIDFGTLRAQGWVKLPIADAPLASGGFPSAGGKCLIDAPGLGVPEHVPNHESALSSPELARRYPLAMISPPARNFLNSTFVNVKSLRDIEGEPLLEIHAADAQPRGIASGQVVRVFNDRGSYLCKAMLSERARPGVVNGLGVWWRKLGLEGSNVNEVTHQKLTDIGRAPAFYDCLVEVRPEPAVSA